MATQIKCPHCFDGYTGLVDFDGSSVVCDHCNGTSIQGNPVKGLCVICIVAALTVVIAWSIWFLC